MQREAVCIMCGATGTDTHELTRSIDAEYHDAGGRKVNFLLESKVVHR